MSGPDAVVVDGTAGDEAAGNGSDAAATGADAAVETTTAASTSATSESTDAPTVDTTAATAEGGDNAATTPSGDQKTQQSEQQQQPPQEELVVEPPPAEEEDSDEDFDDMNETSGAAGVSIPRLDDLVIKALAECYHEYPALDTIPPEYLDSVIALLDLSKITFVVAAKHIATEKFWRRMCEERWQLCQLSKYGSSWKRMYVERHLEELLESYYPSQQQRNYAILIAEVEAAQPFVHALTITQLLSHIDLGPILLRLPHLSSLSLTYGARQLGMDYDKNVFGMKLADVMALSQFLAQTTTLMELSLTQNLLDDELAFVLVDGLKQNTSLTQLDLSHNNIGDDGVKRLCKLLGEDSVLTHVNLTGNEINDDGAKYIGRALKANESLLSLDLRLNPLGERGGKFVFGGLAQNPMSALENLNMCATNLQRHAYESLCELVAASQSLVTLDVSANNVFLDDNSDFLKALTTNMSLTELDVRRNERMSTQTAAEIKDILRVRLYAARQAARKKQHEWDDDEW